MYSIRKFGDMIADSVRMEAHVEALRRALRPGSVVLDIGAGTGIFSLLACRFGASRVYALDPNPAIQVARTLASENGFADRITCIQEPSAQVSLPEKADVIIADLRGVLPLFQQNIPSLIDARQRLLAPGGILIPQRDVLWASIVEQPELYRESTHPWEPNTYDFDFTAAVPYLTNTMRKGRATPGELLSEPRPWGTLDYTTIESPNLSATLEWTVARPGTGHGLVAWFDATLVEGVEFSTAPGKHEPIYGQAFFPWDAPVALDAGDTVRVAIQATLVGGEYAWSWETRVRSRDHADRDAAHFRQSTLRSEVISLPLLHRRAPGFTPELNDRGVVDREVLGLMDGAHSLREIAHQIQARYPGTFSDEAAALDHVRRFSQYYGE